MEKDIKNSGLPLDAEEKDVQERVENKEKIDLKKMVIYSEILKPKFEE